MTSPPLEVTVGEIEHRNARAHSPEQLTEGIFPRRFNRDDEGVVFDIQYHFLFHDLNKQNFNYREVRVSQAYDSVNDTKRAEL